MNEYKVELAKGFPYAQRIRSGVVIGKTGYTGVLTDEQISAIEADGELSLTRIAKAAPGQPIKAVVKPVAKKTATK